MKPVGGRLSLRRGEIWEGFQGRGCGSVWIWGRGMSCFSCMTHRQKEARRRLGDGTIPRSLSHLVDSLDWGKAPSPPPDKSCNARSYALRELAAATRNFRLSNLIGEGGFGKVYMRFLDSGQVVAIKQLSHNGLQGSDEFLVEVLMLIMLHHPNLVSLCGYYAEGAERLLVYEYMPRGSLENHLFGAQSSD